MRQVLFILVLLSLSPQARAAVQADAGPDLVLQSPFIHGVLTGSASGGTPHWYQVSGPAVARFQRPDQAQTPVSLPEPGLYEFRLVVSGTGGVVAEDRVTVRLDPAPELSETSRAVDHVAIAPLPVLKPDHEFLPIMHHDFGVNAPLAMILAERFGYCHFIIPRHDKVVSAHATFVNASREAPMQYPIVPLIMHVVLFQHGSRPEGWPDEAFLRDAAGNLIDFDNGPGVKYYLSPLAPDEIFYEAGRIRGQRLAEWMEANNITTFPAIADQGEWGISMTGGGIGWAYGQDPRMMAAASAAGMSMSRFVSTQIARQHRLVKEGFYTAASLPADLPMIAYSSTGYTIDRARWGAWDAWATYLEDSNSWSQIPSEEFYTKGAGWDGPADGGGLPTDYMHRLLNTVAGQQAILGRTRYAAWMCAGGWPGVGLTSQEIYTGFYKMVMLSGASTILQNDYVFDRAINQDNGSIGAGTRPILWGWNVAAHVYALFSHLDRDLLGSDLLASTQTHPFVSDSLGAKPLYAFRPHGDRGAWVMARKVNGQARWLLATFAPIGEPRAVTVNIPELGEVTLWARASGCVYSAERHGEQIEWTWWDRDDGMMPTRLWFADGPGILAQPAPTSKPPLAQPEAPHATPPGWATPTLSGQAQEGFTVEILRNGTQIGSLHAASGAWRWTAQPLPLGDHSIQVRHRLHDQVSALSSATIITVINGLEGTIGINPDISQRDSQVAHSNPDELGIRFRTTEPVWLVAIRYLKPAAETGEHWGRLWSESGVQLASVIFANESESGWQEARLDQPIILQPGTVYTVSVNANSWYRSRTLGHSVPLSAGPLTTAGLSNGYFNHHAGLFPNQLMGNRVNTFRDVVVHSMQNTRTITLQRPEPWVIEPDSGELSEPVPGQQRFAPLPPFSVHQLRPLPNGDQ